MSNLVLRQIRNQIAEAATRENLARLISKGGREFAELGLPSGKAAFGSSPNPAIQTVLNPERMMFPGIYGNPREIAAEAASRIAPENPMMKRLWGVDRADIDAISRNRQGTKTAELPISESTKPTPFSERITTPRNTQRLQDILAEAGKYPGLRHTDTWYFNDPVFQRLVEMHGFEEAMQRYPKLNTMTGMASPGSDVLTEIQRGTGAHWLANEGRFADFRDLGGLPETLPKNAKPGAMSRETMGDNFPNDMRYLSGHPYHTTSQGGPMERYLQTGAMDMSSTKVPAYVQASETPVTGFQTDAAVGDAHFARGIGAADVRGGTSENAGKSLTASEYRPIRSWWRDKVTAPLGMEAVPGQSRIWNVLGPQTGVDSPLGAGKLELFTQQIEKAARRLGVNPETARDMILSGKAGAGVLAGGAMTPVMMEALMQRQNENAPAPTY